MAPTFFSAATVSATSVQVNNQDQAVAASRSFFSTGTVSTLGNVSCASANSDQPYQDQISPADIPMVSHSSCLKSSGPVLTHAQDGHNYPGPRSLSSGGAPASPRLVCAAPTTKAEASFANSHYQQFPHQYQQFASQDHQFWPQDQYQNQHQVQYLGDYVCGTASGCISC